MTRSWLAVGGIVGTIMLTFPSLLSATEISVRSHTHYAGNGAPVYCGPCGCLRVAYTYHPELRSTYGLDFDPRKYDTTEPHFYFGPVRAYREYYVDGFPAPGSCWR